MLEYLEMTGVGPAPHMRLDFAPRLNLLTGDNGLGKTFVLDVAWYVLTQSWFTEQPVRPLFGREEVARVSGRFSQENKHIELDASFSKQEEAWHTEKKTQPCTSLLLYQRVDGSVLFWDPIKFGGFMIWNTDGSALSVGSVLEPLEIGQCCLKPYDLWYGSETLRPSGRTRVCNGLIDDWVRWQIEKEFRFDAFTSVLKHLSPPSEEIIPAKWRPISIRDSRDYPTVKIGRQETPIPVVWLSAGMRRILALAYMVVWTYTEHLRMAEAFGVAPRREYTILVDELESHLHPRWQRTLLPSLMNAVKTLMGSYSLTKNLPPPDIQIIATTHSPLVMASVEPLYDEGQDKTFIFDVGDSGVEVSELAWAKQGDADSWLVSEVFGLKQARSKEAEEAIEAAYAFMRGKSVETKEAIHQRLLSTLPGDDAFWPRWVVKTGIESGDQA